MKIKQLSAIVIGLILLQATSVLAQFSIGAEIGLPIGDFATVSNAGIGLSGRYEANIKDNINWTGSLGFLSFGGKSYLGGEYGNVSVIPLAGGIKYYFNETNKGWYGAADLNISFIHYSIAYPNSGNGQGVSFASSNVTRVGLAPGAGYRMENWDFTARFNLQADFTYFGLHAAYILPTK